MKKKKKKREELATRLQESFIFHMSPRDFQEKEQCPWRAVGARMLVQLLRQKKDETERDRGKKISVKDINTVWYQPAPSEVINVLANGHTGKRGGKTFIIVIDDLHMIAETRGRENNRFLQILGQLKDLAQRGFVLVCGTSAVSGPIDRLGSRRAIRLEWSPLKLK